MQRLLQFTLDLFDSLPVQPESPTRAPAKPPVASAPPAPSATPAPEKKPKPVDTTAAPAVSLDSVLTPASFRHPQANRETMLAGTHVAYELRRARRRTIGFVVGAEGLVVSAPKWVPLYEIDAALKEKAAWILRKLAETRERHDRIESSRIEWKDGAVIQFLGEPVIVVLDPRHAFDAVGGKLNTDATALPGVASHTLHLGLPHHATSDQIRDAAQAWLMRQAKRIFTERLDHYAPRLGVRWAKLSLSSASTRWGSASADGSIRLNWRLVHFRMDVIDYVVAHELSHLRVMDHSQRFWDTVATVMPGYADLRQKLKSENLAPW